MGTALNPTKSRRPVDMPGITINTLWGEMAYQLAKSAEKPELYEYVKEADKKGVSPGHEALRQLFDACGPCLVLMDELVAYAKKIYGISGLPAGSFDNFISFIYEEWSTLERFQRTRGVLRLMAAVIHELWMNNDASPMIMAGSLPMDVPTVRDELTRYLSEEWNGIVDKEVDGKKTVPYQKDKTPRYGSLMASRRLARTIFLGSAPTNRTQSARGIEAARIFPRCAG